MAVNQWQAVAEERYARIRHIESIEKDLRTEFRREVIELREEVGELVAEVHKLIEREKELREQAVTSALRIVQARTGHLA
jgi:uncharacterized coiled-coil DUF342 family protein